MHKPFTKLGLAAFVLALATGAFAGDLKWHTSLDTAMAESKKTGKPILADFTGSDWCSWCIKLHKEVFAKPEFGAWAKSNVVLLELDFPMKKKQDQAVKKANEALAEKYKIEGFPTVLVLSASGKEIGRLGYEAGGPSVWIKKAETVVKKA